MADNRAPIIVERRGDDTVITLRTVAAAQDMRAVILAAEADMNRPQYRDASRAIPGLPMRRFIGALYAAMIAAAESPVDMTTPLRDLPLAETPEVAEAAEQVEFDETAPHGTPENPHSPTSAESGNPGTWYCSACEADLPD